MFLLDTSVLTRLRAPSILRRIEELDSDGLARTSMTDLEIGFSASPVPGVRFYSGGSDASYIPEREACAQTIMNQAHRTLDFRSVVEAAYADGVRVFIEHGPMGACSGWIREVLGERAAGAVVVALDRKGRGIDTIFDALGALIAAGVSVDPSRLLERLGAASSRGRIAASVEAGPDDRRKRCPSSARSRGTATSAS